MGYTKLAKLYYPETRKEHIRTFANSISVLAFVVLLSDAVWVILSAAKWWNLHPEGLTQLGVAFLRDVFLVGYFYMNFKPLGRPSHLWNLNLAFLSFWFLFAPNPAWTDWTYALRFDYGWFQAWVSFFISHVVGRVLTGLIFLYSLDPEVRQ